MSKSVDELADRYAKDVTDFQDEYTNDVRAFKAGFTARDSEVQALREALACAEEAIDEAEVMFKDVYRVNQVYKGDFHVACPESKFKNALTRIAAIKKANGVL